MSKGDGKKPVIGYLKFVSKREKYTYNIIDTRSDTYR